MSDRYLKAILTVIALELFWIGIKDGSPGLAAQAQPPLTPVVIRGIDISAATQGALPVFSALPLSVEVTSPVKVETEQPISVIGGGPLKVEADRPLPVQAVPAPPARRPGE